MLAYKQNQSDDEREFIYNQHNRYQCGDDMKCYCQGCKEYRQFLKCLPTKEPEGN